MPSANKLQYAIQCDKLQRMHEGTDRAETWLSIMLSASPIDLEEAAERCDLESLLGDDETLEQFMEGDEFAGAFIATAPDGTEIILLQTSGFEFFFTHDGNPPPLFPVDKQLCLVYYQSLYDPLATSLLPARSALAQGKYSLEVEQDTGDAALRHYTCPAHDRLVMYLDNEPIAGIMVKGGVIESVYVSPAHRRRGIATTLFEIAKDRLGDIQHSSSLTEDGKAWRDAVESRQLFMETSCEP